MAGRLSARGNAQPSHPPTPGEVEILRALARFHYLTVEHIMRLFAYKPGMLTTVQERTTRLYREGYCIRRAYPRDITARLGSTVYVYALGTPGRNYVAQYLSIDVPARFRPGDIPKDDKIRHLVAATDVAVAAQLFAAADARVTLRQLHVERALRGMGEPVEVEGKRRRVTPDAWFWFDVTLPPKLYRIPFIVEVDRHSERQKAWALKVRGLLAWAAHPQYQELFGIRSGTFAVISPGNVAHAETLRAWTETVLTELGQESTGERWLFTGENPAVLAPRDFFGGRVWRAAFGTEPLTAVPMEVADV
jgi:hypothetical protein